MVPLLPRAAHDHIRQRGGVQLSVPAGSQGGRDGVEGVGTRVRHRLRRSSQHRQRVHRGAQREPAAGDTGRRVTEHHRADQADRAGEGDGREAPAR